MTDHEKLAELLFPEDLPSPEELEERYPLRKIKEGERVTRFAPSPTGYMHLGNMFSAFIDKLCADATGGIFYLRIEDTDKKREVEHGVEKIFEGLTAFGIVPVEGVMGENEEKGDYGPYRQSHRREIYHSFAKKLVKNGMAYPCFCSEDELNELREKQESENTAIKGYFGKWAKCRFLPFEEQKRRIEAGEPYVVRLRSDGDESKKIIVDDLIKGKIEMPENIQDIVLLKTDGIPTYHFAHAVDDHLMRTTHVIRGDEWIASLPVHIQLFKTLGFKPPKYVHISPIMKLDDGNKRKLSKRKDPEAAVSFYKEEGYPKDSVLEYLLTLANSNFEDWRRANRDADISAFPFNIKKMSGSGALFDIAKMNDISKNIISAMSASEVYDKTAEWAKEYDGEFYALLTKDPEFARSALNIDRDCPKPRKDIEKWSEVKNYLAYFYDELYTQDFTLPENISPADAAEITDAYLKVFDIDDDKDAWFNKIKDVCAPLGYTPNVKEYKKDPGAFKGHVGDISTVIRIAVTSRRNTPDLHAVMAVLGSDKVIERLKAAEDFWKNN
ncbi:MAG: glutamate--tRNA ligase [Clostridiales bacterium]|nr:glutamate--tRNA ligase [Clostridiales bacterium]